jgi:pyruvate kinase
VAIARSTAQLSRDLRVRGIVVFSTTGLTASIVASARPAAPVVAAALDPAVCRRMNLLWGVVPVQVTAEERQDANGLARRLARDLGLAESGQAILTVAGFRTERTERAPSVTVLELLGRVRSTDRVKRET